MSTADTHLSAPAEATPPPSRGSNISMGLLSMVFFIGSEVMLFGSLFAAYGYHTASGQAGMLAWEDNALLQRTSYNSYKRGIAQSVTRRDGSARRRLPATMQRWQMGRFCAARSATLSIRRARRRLNTRP